MPHWARLASRLEAERHRTYFVACRYRSPHRRIRLVRQRTQVNCGKLYVIPCNFTLPHRPSFSIWLSHEFHVRTKKKQLLACNCLIISVDQPGLEPGTFRLWVCCSNQLSYKSNGIKQSFGCAKVRVLSRTTKCLSKNVAHYFLTRVAARLPVCHIVSLFTNKQSYYLATWWELTNFAINIKNSLYN